MYISAVSICVVCERTFMYNPERVPSVVVLGERQPVCRSCMENANVIRKARGLPELEILDGAYEPLEGEL